MYILLYNIRAHTLLVIVVADQMRALLRRICRLVDCWFQQGPLIGSCCSLHVYGSCQCPRSCGQYLEVFKGTVPLKWPTTEHVDMKDLA
jgi:hypothetical protein